MTERKEGYYYLQHPSEPEPSLVYGYKCSDLAGAYCFAFNAREGGGVLPATDLSSGTTVTPVKIEAIPDD